MGWVEIERTIKIARLHRNIRLQSVFHSSFFILLVFHSSFNREPIPPFSKEPQNFLGLKCTISDLIGSGIFVYRFHNIYCICNKGVEVFKDNFRPGHKSVSNNVDVSLESQRKKPSSFITRNSYET